MTRLFNLDAQLLFDTALLALSVYVLFAALSYFLFKPARAVLADRRKRIESELASAKAQRQEAERLGQEYQKKTDRGRNRVCACAQRCKRTGRKNARTHSCRGAK